MKLISVVIAAIAGATVAVKMLVTAVVKIIMEVGVAGIKIYKVYMQ